MEFKRKLIKSVFFRLLLAFTLFIVSMQLTTYFIYNFGHNTLKNEIKQETQSNLNFYHNKLEYEFNYLSQVLNEIINDTNLASLNYRKDSMSTSEFYIRLSELRRQVSTMRFSNELISSIEIIFGQHNKVLSDSFYSDFQDSAAYNQLVNEIKASETAILADEESYYLTAIYPVIMKYTKEIPAYIVRITVDKNSIQKFFSKTNTPEQRDIILYDKNTNQIIQNYDDTIAEETTNIIVSSLGLNKESSNSHSEELVLNKNEYYCIWQYFAPLDSYMIQIVPMSEVFEPLMQYNTYMMIFIGLSFLIIVLYSYLSYNMVNQPVNDLIKAFKEIEMGNYETKIKGKNPNNEFRYLINGFNSMAIKLSDTVNNLYKQEIYSKRMELKQLQMQINPHFLYNSYFILHRLIEQEDFENAYMLSEYLGEYFEYITRNAKDRIELQREWQHATSYINIQAIRYASRIKVDIQPISEEIKDFMVPRLILQPILENAVEHGFRNKARDGIVKLYSEIKDTRLHIFIEDNGLITQEKISELNARIHNTENTKEETTAIINIHRRLQLAYGNQGYIKPSRASIGGLCVEMVLPLSKDVMLILDKNEKRSY